MAGHYKTGEIEWLPLTIYGASFLRFIFEEYNCGLGEGIVMMADDEKQARQFIEEYCKRTTDNGCKISKWNQRSEHLENYCCGFLNMQKK